MSSACELCCSDYLASVGPDLRVRAKAGRAGTRGRGHDTTHVSLPPLLRLLDGCAFLATHLTQPHPLPLPSPPIPTVAASGSVCVSGNASNAAQTTPPPLSSPPHCCGFWMGARFWQRILCNTTPSPSPLLPSPLLQFLDGCAFLATRLTQRPAVEDPFLVEITPDGIPLEEPTTMDLRRSECL